MKPTVIPAIALAGAILAAGGTGWAQSGVIPPRLIPTTLVIERPATIADRLDPHIIWLGVSDVTYGFYLHDAFTDAMGADSVWSTVWQWARQFRPNFQVEGPNMGKLAGIKPGEVVTVRGMCFPATRTFEITEISPGKPFDRPSAY